MVAISSDLIERYARPGPRYTSYPPVPRWSNEPGPRAWADVLGRLDRPTALYVHVPFCKDQCVYCGCNMVVSRRQSAGDRYLAALDRQVDATPPLAMRWVHLGGGTPTWLDPKQLHRLFATIRRAGYLVDGCEISVEVDPMVTDERRLDALVRDGVTRLSLGVQSLDPTVLAAVNRPQSRDAIEELVTLARSRGIDSINVDVMTGLPHQTADTLTDTLLHILRWRPERLSVFGYAHVPWLKRHQRAIDPSTLPGADERAELRLTAHHLLTEAGYVAIGFDHYARPGDPLANALSNGTIGRNFMGYTPYAALPVVALGPSGISEVDGAYVQVESHLGKWWRAIEEGRVPVTRAYLSTADDRVHAAIIESILCRGEVLAHEIVDRFGRLPETWSWSLRQLDPLVSDQLVEVSPERVVVTEKGRFFLRVVAMAFDPSLAREQGQGRYSQTV